MRRIISIVATSIAALAFITSCQTTDPEGNGTDNGNGNNNGGGTEPPVETVDPVEEVSGTYNGVLNIDLSLMGAPASNVSKDLTNEIVISAAEAENTVDVQVKALSDSIRAEVAVTKEGKELSPEAMARIEALSARISANADSITRAIDEKGINALSTLNHHTDSVSAYVKQIPNIIYVVDGKKVSEKKFNKLSPNDIASITVLKGGEANKKYGAKENDNVLIITTRKKK